MSIFDDILNADAAIFADPDLMPGGEAISYTPHLGVARTINANVERDPPTDIADTAGGGAAGLIMVFVQKHATAGVSSVNVGGDSFSIAPRVGGTARVYKVVQIISQDTGGFRLLLRGQSV